MVGFTQFDPTVPTATSEAKQQQFRDGGKATALANGCAWVGMNEKFGGSFAAADALGFYGVDKVHHSAPAMVDYAKTITNLLNQVGR